MDYYTKEQRAEYNKRYKEEHKEEIYLRRKRYQMENYERIKKQNKEYAEANREKCRAYGKAYYHAHKNDADFKERQKISRDYWMKNNRDKWNAYCRGYRKRKALEGKI